MKNFTKVYYNKLIWLFFFVQILILPHSGRAQVDKTTLYKKLTCVIHIHSVFSHNGKLTIEEIVQKAKQKNIDVVIITDHDNAKVEYGLWPFRNIIKKTTEFNSIFQIGIDRYLNEISRVQKKYPEIILIHGAESTPFYWWSGSPFKRNLVLHNWHKHLLIVGFDDKNDYKNLPLVSNGYSKKLNLFSLWPLVVIISGFFLSKKRIGIILVILGLIFTAVNFPFKKSDFDQYHGDQKDNPYQNLIDYVNSKNGLVFWAHPDAPNWEKPTKIGHISMQTLPYPDSLLNTENYTGFAYFWEGERTVGIPGGVWDEILKEYCEGKRKKPVWAISELDYIDDGINNTYIDMAKNILFVKDFSYKSVIDSLKNGRFYAVAKYRKDSPEPVIEKFLINNTTFGEEISVEGVNMPVKVFMKLNTSDGKRYLANINIIEKGKIIKNIRNEIPLETEFYIVPTTQEKTYFRVEITLDGSSKLVTNPILVNLTKLD